MESGIRWCESLSFREGWAEPQAGFLKKRNREREEKRGDRGIRRRLGGRRGLR